MIGATATPTRSEHIGRLYRSKVATSFHEAGHAVAAIVTGRPFRGASLVDDPRSAGRVYIDGGCHDWTRTPEWEPLAIVTAAGMAASATARAEWLGADVEPVAACVRDQWRSRTTREGGHGSHPGYDMPTLRWYARGVWWSASGGAGHMYPDPPDLGPAFDPTWATDPAGVLDIAAYAWCRAVKIVTDQWGAVTAVAELLYNHRDRDLVPADDIRAAAAMSTPRMFDVGAVGTDFWPARHSRLVWRPHGMCRTRRNR